MARFRVIPSSIQRFSCILIGCTFYGMKYVRFSCVCPVIDHEFHHNIVKVAVDLRGDSRVVPQTTLTMLWRNWLSITGKTREKLNCQIVRSRSLTHRINYKFFVFVRLLTIKFSQWAREISAVIVKLFFFSIWWRKRVYFVQRIFSLHSVNLYL